MIYKIPSSPVIDTGSEILQVNLTQREVTILMHLYNGRSQHETAVLLSISPNTVRNHVQNICRKLGQVNTIGCLQWYIDTVLVAEYGKAFIDLATIVEEA
jgi:DNA-binding CsgD family transcriptional regulator